MAVVPDGTENAKGKGEMLITSIFSFFNNIYKSSLVNQHIVS